MQSLENIYMETHIHTNKKFQNESPNVYFATTTLISPIWEIGTL
jgi:hypothetical protein